MADTLEGLFGSKAKARLIRHYLLNSDSEADFASLVEKHKLRPDDARRAVYALEKIKFLTSRKVAGKKIYRFNREFSFHNELYNLIVAANRYPQCKSMKNIPKLGDVRLAMVSGVFLDHEKGKVDLILVINNLDRAKVSRFVESVEAEVGKEVRYMLMDIDDFQYRMEMVDRFLLDFFEGPHEEIINRVPNLKRIIHTLKRQ